MYPERRLIGTLSMDKTNQLIQRNMKINNIFVSTDFQALMKNALTLARLEGEKYGINFKGVNADNINISIEKGELLHVWIHTQHAGKSVRFEVTSDSCKLFQWSDKKGWIEYVDDTPKKEKQEKEMGGFSQTGKKVFCTTLGWDGKDYDGIGRLFPEWKITSPYSAKLFEAKSFIRIYDRSHKCYCFLEVTERLSGAGAKIAQYFTCVD